MDTLPISTFSGYLRSLNYDSLNNEAKTVLKTSFPLFLSDESDEQAEQRARLMTEKLEVKLDYIVLEDRPSRRFALNETIPPRGSYYTVARDPDGNDDYTLQRELQAYMNPEASGAFMVADLVTEETHRLLGIKEPISDKMYVISRTDKVDQNYAVPLPMRTEYNEIERCIDLRRPETQRWFFKTFRTGDGIFFDKPNGTNANNFFDMLLGLMWPELGGGDLNSPGAVVRIIGAWMVSNDIAALVFPSARSNPSVRVEKSNVIDSSGWNLVDYRKAEPNDNTRFVDISPWPMRLPYPITVSEEPDSSPFAGTWRMVGNREGQDKRFDENLKRMLGDDEAG